MADVFISYKREELDVADRVARALEDEGYTTFHDVGRDGIEAGETWDKRLERELADAACCVVLWSPASAESDNVRSEARRAKGRGILVPALIKPCQPPIGLDTVQAANLVRWTGNRADPQWRFLVDRGVAIKVGRPAHGAPKPPPPPPRPPPPPAIPPPRAAPSQASAPTARTITVPRAAIVAGLVALAAVLIVPRIAVGPQATEEMPTTASSADEAASSEGAASSATFVPGDPFRDCPDCPEMVVIPAGSFVMGSPSSEAGRDSDEGPQRTVTLQRFAAGKFEVTFDEWAACVAGGGCRSNPSPGDAGWGRGRRPAINVSWEDAQEYAQWLSQKTGQRYRLLTEAEWEYAARAGTTTAFWWGNSISASQANYDANYTYNGGPKGQYREQTIAVGSFQANPFGLHDVHGNVWEWVQDCYVGTYSGAPSNGAAVTTGDCSSRVVRGGSWIYVPQYLRSASRVRYYPTFRYYFLGFRVARTVSPSNP